MDRDYKCAAPGCWHKPIEQDYEYCEHCLNGPPCGRLTEVEKNEWLKLYGPKES